MANLKTNERVITAWSEIAPGTLLKDDSNNYYIMSDDDLLVDIEDGTVLRADSIDVDDYDVLPRTVVITLCN